MKKVILFALCCCINCSVLAANPPANFNHPDGLIGLGPDILREITREMKDSGTINQFLQTNRRVASAITDAREDYQAYAIAPAKFQERLINHLDDAILNNNGADAFVNELYLMSNNRALVPANDQKDIVYSWLAYSCIKHDPAINHNNYQDLDRAFDFLERCSGYQELINPDPAHSYATAKI